MTDAHASKSVRSGGCPGASGWASLPDDVASAVFRKLRWPRHVSASRLACSSWSRQVLLSVTRLRALARPRTTLLPKLGKLRDLAFVGDAHVCTDKLLRVVSLLPRLRRLDLGRMVLSDRQLEMMTRPPLRRTLRSLAITLDLDGDQTAEGLTSFFRHLEALASVSLRVQFWFAGAGRSSFPPPGDDGRRCPVEALARLIADSGQCCSSPDGVFVDKLEIAGVYVPEDGVRALQHFTDVRRLTMSAHSLSLDVGLDRFTSLTKLEFIGENEEDGFICEVSEANVSSLQSLPSLQLLAIENTSITDGAVAVVGRLSSLRHLSLSRNDNITDVGASHLKNLSPHLVSLNIDCHAARLFGESESSPWTLGPTSASALGQLSRLEHLSVYAQHRALSEGGLSHLTSLVCLTHLDMGRIPVGPTEQGTLSTLVRLRHLGLRMSIQSGGDDAGLPSKLSFLRPLTSMTSLDISSNDVTTRDVQVLQALPLLEFMDVRETPMAAQVLLKATFTAGCGSTLLRIPGHGETTNFHLRSSTMNFDEPCTEGHTPVVVLLSGRGVLPLAKMSAPFTRFSDIYRASRLERAIKGRGPSSYLAYN